MCNVNRNSVSSFRNSSFSSSRTWFNVVLTSGLNRLVQGTSRRDYTVNLEDFFFLSAKEKKDVSIKTQLLEFYRKTDVWNLCPAGDKFTSDLRGVSTAWECITESTWHSNFIDIAWRSLGGALLPSPPITLVPRPCRRSRDRVKKKPLACCENRRAQFDTKELRVIWRLRTRCSHMLLGHCDQELILDCEERFKMDIYSVRLVHCVCIRHMQPLSDHQVWMSVVIRVRGQGRDTEGRIFQY